MDRLEDEPEATMLGCDRPIRCGQRTLCDVPCGEGWVEVLLLCPVAVYTAIWAVALWLWGDLSTGQGLQLSS